MGWRISLYCVPKETADKYKDITQEEYDACGDVIDELEKEKIKYDTLTDVMCSDTEGNFSTKFFKNELDIESDMYFGTISKEQLLNIIEEIRVNHIIKWFDGRKVDKDKLGESWVNPSYRYVKNEPWTPEEAMRANQGEWNFKADTWKYCWDGDNGTPHYYNMNIDMDNKWEISGGNTYEYLIFDLIHILKIFDWENNILLCIGG
jgi:hypothetical protein